MSPKSTTEKQVIITLLSAVLAFLDFPGSEEREAVDFAVDDLYSLKLRARQGPTTWTGQGPDPRTKICRFCGRRGRLPEFDSGKIEMTCWSCSDLRPDRPTNP